ncbi:MAG: VWA domain-containing protein [Candidatus Sericytochromatia bacterium]|nr:MAG: VWA domain-containing protein [Candidatus Sericytochromatia bacterium]
MKKITSVLLNLILCSCLAQSNLQISHPENQSKALENSKDTNNISKRLSDNQNTSSVQEKSYSQPLQTTIPAIPNSATGTTNDIPGANPLPMPTSSEPLANLNNDNYFTKYPINSFVNAEKDPLSTFSLDVDTASYTWMRKSVENNIVPNPDSVRVEEYINYFDYKYPNPENKLDINLDLSNSRVNENKILRVGIQTKKIENKDRKPAVLTFVIDVSGSMNMENRLGLVKQSLEILLKELKEDDKVGIVVFGTNARVLLEHKSISEEDEILKAINSLKPEGSTNTESGLLLGYKQAEKYFQSNSINRVILCSDGVANVGTTSPDGILEKIKKESESGITLSTIGFGMGNYNDTLMEQLANKGDGNYYYVDTLKEAEKAFRENLIGILQLLAKDAKVQVKFNPKVVSEYRLIGYENRNLKNEDFKNDLIDAGDLGIGHSSTALYELKLKDNTSKEILADVFLRYKDVDNLNSVLEISKSINLENLKTFENSSDSFKLSQLVMEYAENLRKSPYIKSDYKDISNQLSKLKDYENDSKVKELISLVNKVSSIISK